jgi:hypothetical protein
LILFFNIFIIYFSSRQRPVAVILAEVVQVDQILVVLEVQAVADHQILLIQVHQILAVVLMKNHQKNKLHQFQLVII